MKGLVEQGVLVHRVVLIAVQGIGPVFQIEDASGVAHADGAFNHGTTMISETGAFGGHALWAKEAGQHGHEAVGSESPRGDFLACVHSDVNDGLALLQKRLTTGDVIDEGLGLGEPRLVALEEEAYAVERHARFAVEPGVMGIHVEEEAVHAQGEVAVQEGLDAGRRLVPHTTNLREAFGLDDVLAIDVRSADGVEHVVGLVVGRRVEPVFAHRHIHIFIMLHAVRDHRGSHTFRRQLHAILLGLRGNGGEEHFVDEFVDGPADVAQHVLTSHHRHACIDGQQGKEVVAPATLKLLREVPAPVLRTALPRVDVQILDDLVVRPLHKQAKPLFYLFLYGQS